MRSRTFLHVCLAILALTAAYHLGARSATAQGGGTIECAGIDDYSGHAYAVVNRYLYSFGGELNPPVAMPIPGSSPAIACGGGRVVLADGSYYKFDNTFTNQWVLVGSFAGAPTPVQRQTLGSVKARYR